MDQKKAIAELKTLRDKLSQVTPYPPLPLGPTVRIAAKNGHSVIELDSGKITVFVQTAELGPIGTLQATALILQVLGFYFPLWGKSHEWVQAFMLSDRNKDERSSSSRRLVFSKTIAGIFINIEDGSPAGNHIPRKRSGA